MKGALVVAALALLFLIAAVLPTRGNGLDKYRHVQQHDVSLADRINHACKPGYEVYDWTTGDGYTQVPAGTVRVTCSEKQPGADNFVDSYIVAVAR